MEGIIGIINETVFAFNSEYNLGKETAKSLMTHCRPAVEKYIFNKVTSFALKVAAIRQNVCNVRYQE